MCLLIYILPNANIWFNFTKRLHLNLVPQLNFAKRVLEFDSTIEFCQKGTLEFDSAIEFCQKVLEFDFTIEFHQKGTLEFDPAIEFYQGGTSI